MTNFCIYAMKNFIDFIVEFDKDKHLNRLTALMIFGPYLYLAYEVHLFGMMWLILLGAVVCREPVCDRRHLMILKPKSQQGLVAADYFYEDDYFTKGDENE